jgi:tRNA pseudouridine13 synthase
MYTIKHLPEDFVVVEINKLDRGIEVKESGEFVYCILKKKDFTTFKAIEVISRKLGVNKVGFAGNKDRVAVTEQVISIYDPGNKVKDIKEDNLSLEIVGRGKCPISLGELVGNKFIIVVRNVENEKVKAKDKIKNFFGEQRFSKNNKDIGKFLIKKNFKEAAEMILETEGEFERGVKLYLKEHPSDYVNAIKKLPKRLISMYVHSYQSYLWNKIAEKLDEDTEIPMIGFGTEIDEFSSKVRKLVEKVMEEEEITYRDFIIKQLGSVSAEGDKRKLFVDVEELVIGDLEDDELNSGKKKVTISFSLRKGSYATEVIKQIIQPS